MFPDVVIRGTILLSTSAYAAAEWIRFQRPGAWRVARLAWTVGALLGVAHAAAAFHFRHAWSHANAWEATVNETMAVTGLAWGGGIYINYAFLAIWSADALWWWLGAASYARRPPALTAAISMFFLFMFLNGAVVFAQGATRWFGASCVGVAGWAWYFRVLERPAFRSPQGQRSTESE